MQKLFIKTLHLNVMTSGGLFGARFHFKEGLNIIRAENTSGKSTCLNAILYALGFEIQRWPGLFGQPEAILK
jgi:predicted ATP-binding protein involved in virulence